MKISKLGNQEKDKSASAPDESQARKKQKPAKGKNEFFCES
jgi:hypothetical protein